MKAQLEKYREWQKENLAWELVCDTLDHEDFYRQWHDLSKAEKMIWIRSFKPDPMGAFEEFGTKVCKFPSGCVYGRTFRCMGHTIGVQGFVCLFLERTGDIAG